MIIVLCCLFIVAALFGWFVVGVVGLFVHYCCFVFALCLVWS